MPQGSILSPVLFLFYVNNLSQCVLYSQVFLCADDAKLYKQISFRLDCILVQQDIDALVT